MVGMRAFYVIDDNMKAELISTLDHIRKNALDRGAILDDCDKIETIITEMKRV